MSKCRPFLFPFASCEYTLRSQMILLALFAALHYPVLARAACRQNLRVSGVPPEADLVSGVRCQERKTKKLKPEH